jgi:hypothetical protein
MALMVELGEVVTSWKMSVSCFRAMSCALPIVVNGAARAGFYRAWVTSLAATMAALVEDIFGMAMLEGRNLTVSAICSLPVLEQYPVLFNSDNAQGLVQRTSHQCHVEPMSCGCQIFHGCSVELHIH